MIFQVVLSAKIKISNGLLMGSYKSQFRQKNLKEIKKGRREVEVKINREIRNYTESIFFGLSLRQFIFSVLACIIAVVFYFLLKGRFGIETLSWVCILGATPFATLGFLTYNGMPAEKVIWSWLKSEFLVPKQLTFKPTNFYYELLKDKTKRRKKC